MLVSTAVNAVNSRALFRFPKNKVSAGAMRVYGTGEEEGKHFYSAKKLPGCFPCIPPRALALAP